MKKKPASQTLFVEPEDAALFRAAVGEVKPIPENNRVTVQKSERKPLFHPPASSPELPDTLSDFITGETPDEFLGNGLSRMTLRKLRRGTWPVQDRLDLHGLNSDAARKLLQEFLHDAIQNNFRSVLVIHGKGINSPDGEAVLRKLARHWLIQHPSVLGFCDAPPEKGGSGAAVVMLKTSC